MFERIENARKMQLKRVANGVNRWSRSRVYKWKISGFRIFFGPSSFEVVSDSSLWEKCRYFGIFLAEIPSANICVSYISRF